MAVAFVATRLPLLPGHEPGPFVLRQLLYHGFWGFAHETSMDFSLLMGSLFLLLVEPVPLSLDERRTSGR
jgi:hypothetical protein